MTETHARDGDERRLWEQFAAVDPPAGPCPDHMAMSAYLEGRASDDDREGVEAHLTECASCRVSVTELRELLDPQRLAAVPVQPVMIESAKAVVDSSAGRRRWSITFRRAAVAAAAIAVATGGYLTGSSVSNGTDHLTSAMTFGLAGSGPNGDLATELIWVSGVESAP